MEKKYKKIAREARIKVLELIYKAQTSHIGSNFSCIDIMTVLFDKIDLEKDKFILSAGWKAAALYYFLWRKGKITLDELNSYCQQDSKFIGLAEPIIPEIPFAGGSMGLGFPAAVGFAMAKKLKGEKGTVYCLISDGELQIGTTYESVLIALQHNLDNLHVIVDMNGFQAMGQTKNILDFDELKTFQHWCKQRLDGHDFSKINKIFNHPVGVPLVTFCHTIKGKGVSFMENNNLYHYKQLSQEEYNNALKELWEK